MNSENDEAGVGQWISNSEIANQVISKYTGATSGNNNKRKPAPLQKEDEEYVKKRARNNVAVKKSREKAKNRIHETQSRVEQLSKENEDLQSKVTLLSKELNVLRALFTNGGFTLPCDLQFMNGSGSGSESVSNHSNPSSHITDDTSIRHHHISSLQSNVDSEKSAFHLHEEGKIPPLRPMPRVPSSHKTLPPVHSGSRTTYERERIYDYPTKSSDYSIKSSEYSKKEASKSPSNIMPLLVQPGHSSMSSSPPYSPKYKNHGETQHTSVIRSASQINGQSQAAFSVPNTLGKFYIIQDPENNGQVKIVPINS